MRHCVRMFIQAGGRNAAREAVEVGQSCGEGYVLELIRLKSCERVPAHARRCKRDQMNNGVAACGYTFDPTDYDRQAVSNMDGRPRLTFQGCRYSCTFP